MNIHDSGYKKLFSNRTIFRQLIETFVHEPWVKELDFSQAKTIDKSFVDDHYKETESDLIYQVGLRGREVYFYVLLEFQSSVNKYMAMRVLHYVSSIYMDLIHSGETFEKLPPIFPIVLYNGDRRWTAPVNVNELIDQEPSLGKYGLSFEYFKIAENEFSQEQLLRIRNIVSTLFLTESHYEIKLLIDEMVNIFEREEDKQAASLLLNWFRQLRENRRIDPADYAQLEIVYHSVEEVKSMLITALEKEREEIREEGRQEGREEGRQEGRQEGREEGIRITIQQILKTRFDNVSDEALTALTNCTLDQLQALINPALDAPDLATFLALIPDAAEGDGQSNAAD